jgi:hypothetical protein
VDLDLHRSNTIEYRHRYEKDGVLGHENGIVALPFFCASCNVNKGVSLLMEIRTKCGAHTAAQVRVAGKIRS